MGDALEILRRSVTLRRSLHLVRPDHGLFVVDARDPALRPHGLEGLAHQLREELAHALTRSGDWTVLVAIGEASDRLADAILSYRQARQTVKVIQVVTSFGPVAGWSQLGIYRLLAQLPAEQIAMDALHPALKRLLLRRDAGLLIGTL